MTPVAAVPAAAVPLPVAVPVRAMSDLLPAFELPPDLEAHEPPEARGLRRDEVRLLVTHRDGGRVRHRRFSDLPDVLRPGDLLVVNDSATLPAALTARRAGAPSSPKGRGGAPSSRGDIGHDEDGAIVLHLSAGLTRALWILEPRPAPVEAGERLDLPAGGSASILVPYPGSQRMWIARLQLPEAPLDYLLRVGRPIAYPYVRGEWPLEMYQTVYAREPGSAEMPSAGRPFTPEVLARAASRGIGLARITLHAGVASLERDEPPIEEWYRIPPETAAVIESTRLAGSRVVAVGTTVVRAVESAVDAGGHVRASQGWTDLVITPERRIRAVGALLTGFHEPRASHLAMLTAIAGRAHLERAYRAAVDAGYLWHEFGDLHLIL